MTWLWPVWTLAVSWVYAIWLEHGAHHFLGSGGFAELPDKSMHPRAKVIGIVLLNQGVQLVVFWLLLGLGAIDTESSIEFSVQGWGIASGQVLIGTVIVDTWQYWWHRLLHAHPWLFSSIHAVHHEIERPYSYSAFFNHLAEGLVLDAGGFAVAQLLTGMTLGPSTILALAASLKTAHDHAGRRLPLYLDPIGAWAWVSNNDGAYHLVHHLSHGRRFNLQQPFWTFWDRLMGTHKSAIPTFDAQPQPQLLLRRNGESSFVQPTTTKP